MADHATSPTTILKPRAVVGDGAELLLTLVRALARAAAREAFAAGTEAPDVPATGGVRQATSSS